MAISFNQLKFYRKQAGYTQEQIAEKIGVSRQAVAKWESGESMPDIESCIRLADFYGTTVDLLVRDLNLPEDVTAGKHVFGMCRMNDKGQITLPPECRKVFHLDTGDMILVLGDEARGIALIKMGRLPFGGKEKE
ncbi:MAG: helix-turn-helix domain-containing protein [Clostridia bacterium]|nr:helix-turn-helix domain-containing protein [Clostridia bacterium]